LRGETIRSAQDVGWMRNLTVAAMMRADVKTFPISATLSEFRAAFPLGSTQRVVTVDDDDRYAGIVLVADAHNPELSVSKGDDVSLEALAGMKKEVLLPLMNVKDAARLFEKTKSEELAVIDPAGNKHVLGLLTESHLMRRYAEELEKARLDLTGEKQ
jgi:chloride channel protein, CIC family